MQNVPFRHLRYGEVLLNYAEACVETGDEEEARTYINMVRKQAGLPDLDGSLIGRRITSGLQARTQGGTGISRIFVFGM